MEIRIAAAYIRVSDERQDEYSPDSQLKLIRDHAKKNGFYIPEEFVFFDDGISAKSVKRRAAFNRMIALAKEKDPPFETIFVWKFSRFARNQEEAIVYKSMLKKNHIDVVSISEPIVDGAFGTLIERIIEWMDEYYLINLSTEVKRGMAEKFSRGEVITQAPQGYDVIDNNYYPNSDAPMIRKIFSMFAGGSGYAKIARELNAQGYTTRRGNKIDNRFIEYVVNNPVYIGKLRWSSGGRTVSRRKYDDPNIMLVDGSHEPLIDIETWEKSQERIAALKVKYSKHRRETTADTMWMLKGIVKCSNCGGTLTYAALKYPSAQCYRYAHGQCSVSHCITITKLNAAFVTALEACLEMDDLNIVYRAPQHQTGTKSYDKLIAAEERKLARVKEAYENGIDDLQEYQLNKQRISDAIRKLESERAAQIGCNIEAKTKALKSSIQDVLAAVKSPDLSEAIKRDLICDIISHIIYDKATQSLHIYFLS